MVIRFFFSCLSVFAALAFAFSPAHAKRPSCPGQAQAASSQLQEYTIRQMEDLTSMLDDSSSSLLAPVKCRLARDVRNQICQFLNYQGFFNYCNSFSYETLGSSSISLSPGYRDSVRMLAAAKDVSLKASLTERQQNALEQAQEIVSSVVRPEMGDEEKALALHDAVVTATSYDRSKGGAVDVLLDNRGRCEAYANTMQLLLSLAGLPNRLVLGTAKGQSHAWNIAQIDGVWYHIDATWDDPIICGGRKQLLVHTYFMANDQQMARDHRWEQDDLPRCDGAPCPYYQKKGLYFTSYPQFWKAASEAIANGQLSFEAYLVPYGSKSQFQVSFYVAQAQLPNLSALCAWKAPSCQEGVVRLEFDPSGSSTHIVEDTEDSW